MKDDERAEDSIRRGVEGAGSERGDGERDQANSDQPLESPVVAAVRRVRRRDRSRVVQCSLDGLRLRRQDLLLRGGVESHDLGDPSGIPGRQRRPEGREAGLAHERSHSDYFGIDAEDN